MEYFILVRREKQGPFSAEELTKHGLSKTSMIWATGFDQWKKAEDVNELKEVLDKLPPDPPHLIPPKNWLVESILVTCLCSIPVPLGIIAIINAVKSEVYFKNGNYQLAERYAADAKKWCIWGCFTSAVLLIMYTLVILAIAAFGFVLENYNN